MKVEAVVRLDDDGKVRAAPYLFIFGWSIRIGKESVAWVRREGR